MSRYRTNCRENAGGISYSNCTRCAFGIDLAISAVANVDNRRASWGNEKCASSWSGNRSRLRFSSSSASRCSRWSTALSGHAFVRTERSLIDIVALDAANTILFVPWGFLAFIALSPKQPRAMTYVLTIVFGAIFSLAVAAWQATQPAPRHDVSRHDLERHRNVSSARSPHICARAFAFASDLRSAPMILVVEDDPHVARLIALVLQRNGQQSRDRRRRADGAARARRSSQPSMIFADLDHQRDGRRGALQHAEGGCRDDATIPYVVVSGDRDIAEKARRLRRRRLPRQTF